MSHLASTAPRRAALARWLSGGALVLLSCAAPDGEPSAPLALPSARDLAAVSSVLEPSCGTLDCHGSAARSLRIYGRRGLRIDGADTVGGAPTTEAEIAATHASLVAIEPERLHGIFASGGATPERWLVIAKARNRIRHAGGDRLPAGSAGDRCLVSWAAGAVDQAACTSDTFGPIPRPGETW